MRKFWIWFLSILGALIVAIIIIYVFTSTILGYILSSSFGTKTTVNSTAITFRSTHFWGLHVHNPPKAKTPYALTIRKIDIKAPLSTYFTKNIQIEEINLKNLLLIVEVLPGEGNKTNWDAILNHINSSTGEKEGSTRNATIKKLTINKLVVKVISADGNVQTTTIKNLTFRDLSTKKGNITSQIAKVIVMKMIFNAKNILNFPIQLSNDSYNQFFNKMKKGMHIKVK
ncbi:hypothetical protein K0U07_00010 [bacterium]|nr:hypothetical protein [bacterium]